MAASLEGSVSIRAGVPWIFGDDMRPNVHGLSLRVLQVGGGMDGHPRAAFKGT